jgi:hypothetical protein
MQSSTVGQSRYINKPCLNIPDKIMAAKRYFRKKGFWLLNAYIAHQIQPLLSFLPNIPVRKIQKIAKMEISSFVNQ